MKDKIKKGIEYLIEHIKAKMSDTRTSSRKYKLILLIFLAATFMCVLPPVLSVFVFKTEVLIILSGTQWVTVMSMISGFYFGANVIQKQITKADGTSEVNIEAKPSQKEEKT